MRHQTNSQNSGDFSSRYIPLAVWIIAVLAGILIPLKIIGLGFVPQDDAMYHAAKAVSGKSWPEILVIRDGFGDDEHPGWHAILGAVHRATNWDSDELLTFLVIVPFVIFWLVMLAFRKRPEALLLALFVGSLAAPDAFERLLKGRPYIFVLIVFVVLLRLWSRAEKISPATILLSVGLIGVSVWVHGSWYLFGILLAGFALAGDWRKTFSLTACVLAGIFLGATFTGRPFGYIRQTLAHLFLSFQGHPLERMLVTELQPDPGDVGFVIILALALVWRQARGEKMRGAICNPVFALMVLGWLLGLKVARFWTDWGFPAALVWLALELENVLENQLPREKLSALLLACFAAAGVYIVTTRDSDSRWTACLKREYLTPDNPRLAGWLPENGGIVYSPDMHVFYQMFFKNPKADWRYICGYESGVMPEDDLAIRRNIQWNDSDGRAYEPWVEKMKPQDRMILFKPYGSLPNIPGLEWKYPVANTYIGRLPRTNSVPNGRNTQP